MNECEGPRRKINSKIKKIVIYRENDVGTTELYNVMALYFKVEMFIN